MPRTLGRHRAGAPPAGAGTAETGSGTADPDLLAAVRGGDTAAFGVLYDRHRDAARRLARALVRDPSDAEDLVAEAVAKVLAALRDGRGPAVAFRAYLLTAVRNACYDRARKDRRIELTEDLSRYESADRSPGGNAGDPTLASLERSYAARAFARLPERWRVVLWHTEVEGEKPATVAVLLGLSPNAVAALAYRARERLRQMYLQEHLTATTDPACHWTADRLGAHVRGGLARRERSRVDTHLAGCPDCRRLQAELAEVNSGLREVLGPLVLGAAASPYLTTVPHLTWWAAVVGWWQTLAGTVRDWWSGLLGWGRDQVQRYGPGNVAAGAGVALAALLGLVLFGLALALGPGGQPGPDGPGGAPPRPPAAAEPGPPVPAPAPDPTATPTPTPDRSGPPPGTGPGSVPAAVPPDPPPPPAPPEPDPDPIVVAPDLTATSLTAAEPGELAITVHLPAAPESGSLAGLIMDFSPDRPGDTPEKLHDQPDSGEVELVVGWPDGITLTGTDAGDGWRCTARDTGAACRRTAWPARQARTATLPVAVAETLGGYAPVDIAVTAGRRQGQARVRVPVAPAGLRVGYAVTGRYRLAMAGNTWLSCPGRPDCLAAEPLDNNLVPMVPYLPGDGEPVPPDGLAGGSAVSGAAVTVPTGAEVAWAALHWASTAEPPPQVQLHLPGGGGWQPVRADRVRAGEEALLRQASADVTELVRGAGGAGGGTWWLATGAAGLPTGQRASAGWNLVVVYRHPDAPRRDLAVFTDPVTLAAGGARAVTASAPGQPVEVGLVLWEGDRSLTGDSLVLDGQPLGDPDNLAASRAAGALECGDTPPAGCGWHTFGVDVARHRGTAGTGPAGGTVTLRTGADQLQVGVLVLAVPASR